MKKKSPFHSVRRNFDESGFFKLRVLFGVLLYFAGITLVFVVLGKASAQPRKPLNSVSQIASQRHVAAAVGGLTLTDLKISGKVTTPGASARGTGSGPSTKVNSSSFGVDGVDTTAGARLGPLSSGKITSGRGFTASDSDAKVAVVSAGYAHQQKLTVGSKLSARGVFGDGS